MGLEGLGKTRKNFVKIVGVWIEILKLSLPEYEVGGTNHSNATFFFKFISRL
jgi:hypothetical protein